MSKFGKSLKGKLDMCVQPLSLWVRVFSSVKPPQVLPPACAHNHQCPGGKQLWTGYSPLQNLGPFGLCQNPGQCSENVREMYSAWLSPTTFSVDELVCCKQP